MEVGTVKHELVLHLSGPFSRLCPLAGTGADLGSRPYLYTSIPIPNLTVSHITDNILASLSPILHYITFAYTSVMAECNSLH